MRRTWPSRRSPTHRRRRRQRAIIRSTLALVAAFVALATGALADQPPSPAPAPAPLPTPAPKISVDKHAFTLAPGATVSAHVYGATHVHVVATFPAVTVSYDPGSHTLTIASTSVGSGTVSVGDDFGNVDAIAVSVLPPAGVVPTDASVDLAGMPTRAYLIERVRAAVVAATTPDTKLHFNLDTQALALPAALPANYEQDLPLMLKKDGAANVAGIVHVHVNVTDSFDVTTPATLLYSDDPERVDADGVLFRSTVPIDHANPARLYAYHATATPDRQLYLILRTKGAASRVQLVGGAVGPYGDFVCVGHVATKTFLERLFGGVGSNLDVTAAAPAVVRLNRRSMPMRTLVAAIFDIHVLSGDPIDVQVVTAASGVDPLTLSGGNELPGDGHQRRGEYDLRHLSTTALSYTTGQTDDASLHLGSALGDASDQVGILRPSGAVLAGEYGVLRRIDLSLTNPASVAKMVYLYMTPANGADTFTMWFPDVGTTTEIPRVAEPSMKYLIRAFTLAPGEKRQTAGLFMDDGAAWYPLEVGLTETPPQAVDPAPLAACTAALAQGD